MKFIAIAWRDLNNNMKLEKYEAELFSVKTDPGWLKILGKDGPIRLIPSDKIHIVEFVDEPEPSRITSPHAVAPLQPPKGVS